MDVKINDLELIFSCMRLSSGTTSYPNCFDSGESGFFELIKINFVYPAGRWLFFRLECRKLLICRFWATGAIRSRWDSPRAYSSNRNPSNSYFPLWP